MPTGMILHNRCTASDYTTRCSNGRQVSHRWWQHCFGWQRNVAVVLTLTVLTYRRSACNNSAPDCPSLHRIPSSSPAPFGTPFQQTSLQSVFSCQHYIAI